MDMVLTSDVWEPPLILNPICLCVVWGMFLWLHTSARFYLILSLSCLPEELPCCLSIT